MTEKPQEQKKPKSQLAKNMEEFAEKDAQKTKECKAKADQETYKHAMEQEKKSRELFQHSDILLKIKEELDKDHIGDDKAKLFLFACACSSQLRPEYRFSTAITGDTSEGKDNLWKTVFQHLSDGWFLDLTRITTSCLEDDILDYNGLYFGEGNFEGGVNAPIKDTIKQLVEDGVRILKKDVRKNYKKKRYEDQPRKVGIYSTTEDSKDQELASRYCIISVHGSPSKYKLVNENTKCTASDINKIIDKIERTDIYSWIANGLKLLPLSKIDIILIPWAELLEVESRDARSQRDFKRFLNLIRVLAWLCQENRMIYSHRGFNVLIAAAEDFYNAIEIGKEIFDQSLSGLEPRLQRFIDSYSKISKQSGNQTKLETEDKEDANLTWVDRSLIQKDLEIKKRETVQHRLEQLCSMGLFVYFAKSNRTYVAAKFLSPSDLPSNYPLITVPQRETYDMIKDNELAILKEKSDGRWTVKRQKKPILRTSLLSLSFTDRPISSKTRTLDNKTSLISTLKQKSDGKNRTVDGQQENKKTQYERVSEVKQYIEKAKAAGQSVSYIALADHFSESDIGHLIESKQLIKLPDGNYTWGG